MKDQKISQTRIRFRFYKKNEFKYLSHLDIVGIINKALRRAKIRVRYSQGFNPRPVQSFSPPIPLGLESEAEYSDIMIVENMDSGTFMRKLNEELMPQLKITEAKIIPDDAKKLMNDIAITLYGFSLDLNAMDGKKTGTGLDGLISEIKASPGITGSIFKIDTVEVEGSDGIVFLKLFGYAKILEGLGNKIFKYNDFISILNGLAEKKGITLENAAKKHCFVFRGDILKTPMEVF